MEIDKRRLYLMGTVIELWVDHDHSEQLLDQAEEMLIDYERRFSANDASSDLMRINQQAGHAPVSVREDLFELIQKGKEQSILRDSYLNIAIGPLIQEWRVGFKDAKFPTDGRIKQLLTVIDPRYITLDDERQSVFLEKKGMAIDLGALAKGYFADKVIEFFKRREARAGLIDLGGNVLTFGDAPNHADGKWRVAIQNPFLPRGHSAAIVLVKNQSVVTSGIYERRFEWQGKSYHHIFDSETGYPLQSELASLTVISDESLVGEIWTTRLFGKKAVTVIRELRTVAGGEGLVITTDGQLAHTEGVVLED
ncbi:FAD:protein FMN transferase [Vagococcus sp. BWB3-3]|uniref:FAD:protein FMN transferase n=2 Tax=Vagococcus allomyrinae TaxID=2794353 RepID=A0A940PBA2_9ENTE|nr:FAD:protein FMN transferase [Vagococcus allomyrinae]